jgi:ABC-type molybdate transport system substrate-binding protein
MCAIFTPRDKNEPMKHPFLFIVAAALLTASALCASARDLAIFADQAFRPALQEVAKAFTEQTGFEVQLSLGRSSVLAERIIRGGNTADVFFPNNEESMRQVMEKGLVDVALKRNILVMPATEPAEEGVVAEPQFTSAAVLVNATNRLQAMAFLEYLVSEPARAVFAHQGFTLP